MEKVKIMISNEKKALKLLKKAAQHLQEVVRMVEEKEYCLDIIQKSRMVQRYMKMADEKILSGHLQKYVKGVLHGEDTDRQLQEIMLVFKRGRG
ncbi:metal-sensing transcriptional repressor [Patescibacteria group bacterium]|nr:metal-sensing transcriptional repressor [Patescibacteria group bacterium]